MTGRPSTSSRDRRMAAASTAFKAVAETLHSDAVDCHQRVGRRGQHLGEGAEGLIISPGERHVLFFGRPAMRKRTSSLIAERIARPPRGRKRWRSRHTWPCYNEAWLPGTAAAAAYFGARVRAPRHARLSRRAAGGVRPRQGKKIS